MLYEVITPGFIDTHIHFPQTEMVAAYGEQLLAWLNSYTFPTERKFADQWSQLQGLEGGREDIAVGRRIFIEECNQRPGKYDVRVRVVV